MIGYIKGPLGWAVTLDGRPIGSIRQRRREYLVAIDGFRPGVDPATRGQHVFPSLREAKKKISEVIGRGP